MITIRFSSIMATIACSALLQAQDNPKKIIADLYKDKTGFSISSEESNAITHQGGAPTYGEILPESIDKLIEELNIGKDDVFYDLGSGIGKMPMQIYLSTPIKKSIGVELSQTRHDHAINVLKQLKEKKLIDPIRTLDFYNKNILDIPLHEATVIYMASTCFSDELMKSITEKLAQGRKGLRVATLKQLAPHQSFKLIKTLSLPMTWSKNSTVYIYELQ